MTSDLDVIFIFGVPVAGIAELSSASARQVFFGNGELVRLTGADHELTLSPVSNLAGNGAVEESVAQSFHDDFFEMRERLGELAATHSRNRGS